MPDSYRGEEKPGISSRSKRDFVFLSSHVIAVATLSYLGFGVRCCLSFDWPGEVKLMLGKDLAKTLASDTVPKLDL